MKRTVRQDEVFIFINRRCDCMKILHMECGGLILYHLKPESGAFKLPAFDEGSRAYHSSRQELMLMVRGGCSRSKKVEKKP